MSYDYCSRCQSRLQPCATCQGRGQVYKSSTFGGGGHVACPTCKGTGKICPKHGNNYG